MATAFALWGAAAWAHDGEHDLVVKRVVTPEAARAFAAKGLPVPGVMSPADREVLQKRIELRRSFQPFHDLLMGKGRPGIDHSGRANRRAGWRPSALDLAASGTGPAPPDTFRLALVRIEFRSDRGGAASSGNGRFDLSGPDLSLPPIDRPPHNRDFYQAHGEALKRYYEAQSYRNIVLEVDVWPRAQNLAYSVSDMADFGPWAFSPTIYESAVRMTKTMLAAADSQALVVGDAVPWDRYDRVCIVHAGGDLQSDIRQDSKSDIPSFTIFLADSDRVFIPNARPIDRCAYVPETINQDGQYGTINGVLAHESGHNLFGFADVYNVETGFPVVGYWNLMDSGNLSGVPLLLQDGSELYATGLVPPSVDPFQRQFIGGDRNAYTPVPVAWGDTMVIRRSDKDPGVVRLPLTSDEYLLLENRYQPPGTLFELDQDPVTRVVLGPKPDPYAYDVLAQGSGILAWHVDESVIPFETSLRINPGFGWNTNPFRLGIQIVEADGLDDLGDPGSPYILGSPLDPFTPATNAVLSDSTQPPLAPNVGSRPHTRIQFLPSPPFANVPSNLRNSGPDSVMYVAAHRSWSLPDFPVAAAFPPGGPDLLAIDADGDRAPEVCWAGGDPAFADSVALFAIRANGRGLFGTSPVFAAADQRPRPQMAAALLGDPLLGRGPALFAYTTYWYGAADTSGGRVWLVDHQGVTQPGWPVRLPSPASTPPMILGTWPNALVLVGAEDGRVYALQPDGATWGRSSDDAVLPGGVRGRLAGWQGGPTLSTALGGPPSSPNLVAAGGAQGDVTVLQLFAGTLTRYATGLTPSAWPRRIGPASFEPDFLWLRFGGEGAAEEGNCAGGQPTLVAHHADRLWAYCPQTATPLEGGWGRDYGDTIVAGLGAGDPDGDGFPEVLVQTRRSEVAFVNRTGFPSPGWPRRGTREDFPSSSAPLSVDLDADGRSEVVTLNASGLATAFDRDGRVPQGWPLGTGSGVQGSILAADLDRDGRVELVAPDRFGLVYAFTVPSASSAPLASAWTMAGGDVGRSYALPADRTPTALAATPGPLVRASLKAYPNPARNKPVAFAFTLTEACEVEFRIADAAGHEVARFRRPGQRADNVVVWEPGSVPAGLYVASITFSGARGSRTETVPVGLIR